MGRRPLHRLQRSPCPAARGEIPQLQRARLNLDPAGVWCSGDAQSSLVYRTGDRRRAVEGRTHAPLGLAPPVDSPSPSRRRRRTSPYQLVSTLLERKHSTRSQLRDEQLAEGDEIRAASADRILGQFLGAAVVRQPCALAAARAISRLERRIVEQLSLAADHQPPDRALDHMDVGQSIAAEPPAT